jgi:hypothetical protein
MEKFFLEKNQSETRIACGGHVWNRSAKWTDAWKETSMEGPL